MSNLLIGDKITCQGTIAEIKTIHHQEYYTVPEYLLRLGCEPYEEWFIEFEDTKGKYRSWKSSIDGGFIIRQ